jgi:hypothetical protein
LSDILGIDGLLGSSLLGVDDLLGSDGIDVSDAISKVGDLLEDVLGSDISLCVALDLSQNHLFYKFNSACNNHLVLHGFTSEVALNVALFTGDCDNLTCVFVDLDFCANDNHLAIVN